MASARNRRRVVIRDRAVAALLPVHLVKRGGLVVVAILGDWGKPRPALVL
jgi:hypothetical protein